MLQSTDMKVILIKPLPGAFNEDFNKKYAPGTIFETRYTSPDDRVWSLLLENKMSFFVIPEEKQCFKALK